MTGFPQLLCGWAMVNLESSGAGVGVVARSADWPAHLGSTVREMGSLVTMPGEDPPDSPESFALEFSLVGGLALAGLKTPSNARPGTCVTHLVAGETGALDGVSALYLYDSGGFVRSLNGSISPTDQWEPAGVPPDDENPCRAAVSAALDAPWLPALIGAALARLAGQGPAVALHVDTAMEAVSMLRALYGVLPRKPLRELTFSTFAEQSASQPVIVAVVAGNGAEVSMERATITRDSSADGRTDTFSSMGREIVRHRKAGVALPESLSTVHDIYQWCYQRHLRTLEPALLDDEQLAAVITDPELTADWFAEAGVARRAIRLALDKPAVAKALGRLDYRRDVHSAFEKALIEHVKAGGRERTRAAQLAGELGFDISEAVEASAWQRLDDSTLSAADAQTVWPRVRRSWESGGRSQREQVLRRIEKHRALREFALASNDRALVYEAIRAEVSDPAVHTGSSQLLLHALYTHLEIVAQLTVNISATSRDRYILEQILSCAPEDRLPQLIAACARYTGADAIELMRAVTLVRAEPADIVAALRPGWGSLRTFLSLPEPITPLVTLDATAEERAVDKDGRRGLPSPLNLIRRRQTEWHESEIVHMFSTADNDYMIEDCYEILRAAIDSDIGLVADCMADRSRTATGASVLARAMASAGRERLPLLIAAVARHPDVDPYTLLHAAATLRLDSGELVEILERGWRSLRLRLNLPHRIATLLVLDAPGLGTLPRHIGQDPGESQRRNIFRR